MHDRLNRPNMTKTPSLFARPKDSKGSGGSDGLPAGLRLLEDAKSSVGLSEILAAITADSAPQDMRLREVEDSIRRHWAVLRNLVREHADLTRAAMHQTDLAASVHHDRPMPKVALFVPNVGRGMAAE